MKYKFNFKVDTGVMRISGDGSVSAEVLCDAYSRAEAGVAKDLKCDESEVVITQMREARK